MEIEEFEYHLKTLEKFYGRALKDEQKDLWFQKLGWVHAGDFKNGISAVSSEERQFPTPQILLKHIDNARMIRGQKEREIEERQTKSFLYTSKRNPGLSKDCMQLIDLAFKHKHGGVEVAKGMLKLEDKYPDLGFQEQAKGLMEDLLAREDSNDIRKRA